MILFQKKAPIRFFKNTTMAKRFELIDKESKKPLELISLDAELSIFGFLSGTILQEFNSQKLKYV